MGFEVGMKSDIMVKMIFCNFGFMFLQPPRRSFFVIIVSHLMQIEHVHSSSILRLLHLRMKEHCRRHLVNIDTSRSFHFENPRNENTT